MVILAVIALVGGVVYGLSGLEVPLLTLLTDHSNLVLYLLMFLVGISIGMHEGIWAKIKQYHIKAFLIPIGIILGSLIGGAVCAPLLGFSVEQGHHGGKRPGLVQSGRRDHPQSGRGASWAAIALFEQPDA